MKIQKNISSKIALLSLLLFFVGMTTTFAQRHKGKDNNSTPAEKAEKRSQKFKTDFELNDTQTAQVKASLEEQITAMEALKEEGRGEEQKAKMDAIKSNFDAEIKEVFTAEQYEAYEAQKEEQKGKMGGKGKKGGKGKRN